MVSAWENLVREAMAALAGIAEFEVEAAPGLQGEIGDMEITHPQRLLKSSAIPGRRMRVWFYFPRTVHTLDGEGIVIDIDGPFVPQRKGKPWTYGSLLDTVSIPGEARDYLSAIPLRVSGLTPAQVFSVADLERQKAIDPKAMNPNLHPALQDLGWLLAYELTQACHAFDNPDLHYPGVETEEPVTDEHVQLVIMATQRELDRELRYGRGAHTDTRRPAAPLDKLPWRIQRAFVERRRYLYSLYGIGQEEWQRGTWSLWKVREDPDWLPPWIAA